MSTVLQYTGLRNSFAVLALCALAVGLPAQRPHPSPAPFLPMEWGLPVDSLMQRAVAAGWEFLKVDEDGDYAFRGRVRGEDAIVFATIGDTGLTRLLVSFIPHPGAELTYHRIADTLRAHFGSAALESGTEGGLRPAHGLEEAAAWPGILMGLRWDRRIILVFTCPAASPKLPVTRTYLTST